MGRVNFIKPSKRTRNYHYNYLKDYHQIAKVYNLQVGDSFSRYNKTATAIQQQILQKCVNENRRARVIGSKWSLSEAPFTKDYTVDISSLTLTLPLVATDKHANNSSSIDNYHFIQGGKKIKSISSYLRRFNKSLKTSGASNGQTIAGALSTGVHGSAFGFGSVQEMIVGINIITDTNKIIYLERASRPILNDQLAVKINSTVIRDDNLFNAALVSIGSFGFIHGVVIETEDIFLLERHIIRLQQTEAIDLAINQNFAASNLLPKPGIIPYHYKLYVNPFKRRDNIIAEVLYKKPFGQYTSPLKEIKGSYFGDIPKLIGLLRDIKKDLADDFANLLEGEVFPNPTEPISEGTLADIFYDTSARGSVFGIAIGVPSTQIKMVLNALKTIIVNNNIPGMLSIRLVKGTKATLGFTRFPKTAIVELDGVSYNDLDKHLNLICNLLSNTSNLDFTLHWGKNGDWSSNLIKRMYTTSTRDYLVEWLTQRKKLLSAKMRGVFSSDYLDLLGLT